MVTSTMTSGRNNNFLNTNKASKVFDPTKLNFWNLDVQFDDFLGNVMQQSERVKKLQEQMRADNKTIINEMSKITRKMNSFIVTSNQKKPTIHVDPVD
jgi:hypothetical protein